MKYYVNKVESDNIAIDDVFWSEIEPIRIEYCPWKKFKTDIKTTARVVYSDKGLTVRFETDEKPLRATITKDQDGDTCTDSCVEFFFRRADSNNYINVEVNPFGKILMSNNNPGKRRKRVEYSHDILKTTSRINGKTWALQFFLPFDLIEREIGALGDRFFANFYKCGELTEHRHYACWNPIESAKPQFHLPEFFGEIILK